MNLQLKNKTAFISGSTAGIGFAIAKILLSEGAKVIINGRDSSRIDEAIAKLQQDIPDAEMEGVAADFSKVDEVNTLLSQLPTIDILINNIGIYQTESFFESKDETWLQQFEVNVMSGMRLSRQLLPKMMEQNWGRIIFISSECASLSPTDSLAYNMTKAAMLSLSRGLAEMTKGTQVTVNTVVPGSTLSEGAQQFLKDVAARENKTPEEVETDFFNKVRTSSLLQRFASVEEVANTVAFYVSPLAAATNGAAIKVDGGSMGGIV